MYREPVQTLQSGAERALAATGFDDLIHSSGRAMR
jgi:hypothetical protein